MSAIKILVVEDESIVALDISNRLRQQGHHVLCLSTFGEDGVDDVALIRPDLILMDIGLKGMVDGIEAAHRIRSRFDIPLIFLTAYSDKITLARALQADPSGYLTKPFEESELKRVITEALEISR